MFQFSAERLYYLADDQLLRALGSWAFLHSSTFSSGARCCLGLLCDFGAVRVVALEYCLCFWHIQESVQVYAVVFCCNVQVKTAYAAVSASNRELIELQQNNAEFGAALEAVGTRGELAEVKRRLETHQTLVTQWEEKVAQQLEFISELQSPTNRNSMRAAATRASSSLAGSSATGGPVRQNSRQPSLAGSLSGNLVSQLGWQGGGYGTAAAGSAAGLKDSSVMGGSAAAVGAAAGSRTSSAFGSSFASLKGGLPGAASAPNSPALWANPSSPGGTPGGARRAAFTPGPALTGMGDSTPGANTPV